MTLQVLRLRVIDTLWVCLFDRFRTQEGKKSETYVRDEMRSIIVCGWLVFPTRLVTDDPPTLGAPLSVRECLPTDHGHSCGSLPVYVWRYRQQSGDNSRTDLTIYLGSARQWRNRCSWAVNTCAGILTTS